MLSVIKCIEFNGRLSRSELKPVNWVIIFSCETCLKTFNLAIMPDIYYLIIVLIIRLLEAIEFRMDEPIEVAN